ncbi:hypothetical protein O9H85_08375 [Paenibacillus filicis]|uniref:PepSY domain-containing protein n=1 Tax=Paenibacillus gyeongsangnamensis TaxID=3388067 RepID=A0ABT4Q6E3_9BACL|nr:hypothetical protein [Paenibacillus filicis]MCZ8512448.1 hypothetical protein [Paenibacillus filicis]
MRTYRRLHLWVGLVCCLLILMESLTGLLISESWLSLGQFTEHRLPAPGAVLTASQEAAAPDALA